MNFTYNHFLEGGDQLKSGFGDIFLCQGHWKGVDVWMERSNVVGYEDSTCPPFEEILHCLKNSSK